MSLKNKLSQQEVLWKGEKACIEEFYDTQNTQLRDANKQLLASNQLLRKESDSLLLQMHTTRQLLADLRHRFDLGNISWNEEKDLLKAKLFQVGWVMWRW